MSAGSWCWKNLFHYGYGFRTLPDYDAIMTRLRRDSVSDDVIASCLFPGSIPCWASCCQGASWGIVDFLGDYVEPIPHEREVCDWNLGACKCVQVREKSARICFNRLLLLMQPLSAEPPRAREENVAHSECRLGSVQLFRCYLRTYIQRQLALLLLP